MSDLQDYLDKALSQVKLDNINEETDDQGYDINAEVSELIISVRTSLCMTQKQLAEKSGVSQANISKMEKGRTLPSIPILKRISEALGKRLVIDFADREENE